MTREETETNSSSNDNLPELEPCLAPRTPPPDTGDSASGAAAAEHHEPAAVAEAGDQFHQEEFGEAGHHHAEAAVPDPAPAYEAADGGYVPESREAEHVQVQEYHQEHQQEHHQEADVQPAEQFQQEEAFSVNHGGDNMEMEMEMPPNSQDPVGADIALDLPPQSNER